MNNFGLRASGFGRHGGFTLIELLVVIAIIGILATTVMTSLNSARAKARDVRRIADIHQLQLALQLAYDTNGRYPAALTDLTPVFISAAPKDPDGLSDYQYCVSTSRGYHLGTRPAGLEVAADNALLADADAGISGHPDGCLTGGFSGEDPVYDVIP